MITKYFYLYYDLLETHSLEQFEGHLYLILLKMECSCLTIIDLKETQMTIAIENRSNMIFKILKVRPFKKYT